MGGKWEARRGGSAGSSARVVIPLLHAVAAGGCAEGRSVENGRKERDGEKGSAWAALQQLQQPVRTKGKKKEGCRIAQEEAFGFFSACLEKENGTGIDEKAFFSTHGDAFLYGLLQKVCLEIVERAEEI